ncbi:MAG: hypothetical protein NTU53_22355 [Planctomycetota bacterium]|nr:hypothetical protein [Planctomycetota bacterium]
MSMNNQQRRATANLRSRNSLCWRKFQKSTVEDGFDGRTPAELLAAGEWAWHDLGTAARAPEGAMTVWTFNGKSARWGTGKEFALEAEGLVKRNVGISTPANWISAATFLAGDGGVQPDTVVLHIANESAQASLSISSVRLWLPKDVATWQTLWAQAPMPVAAEVPSRDKGIVKLRTNKLPLTYVAIEVGTNAGPVWAHLRIKREAFGISGGWVGGNLTKEPYLKLLQHLHVNTGHFDAVPGYTDNPALYDRYPLRLFNRLWPLDKWDTDAWLPKIHAVEFLGEPQYGGGRPVPPQEVFDKLLPYRDSRLATSITDSEERIWRWYAGLSDYPHYDAYRVVAPSPDSWGEYDRWGGRRIRWGAPLETIGDMCRSLRELNRPMPCAYWSQGPHEGWGGRFDGRSRRSPTPDELRAQAVHALSTRITSLYWFNLSLKSLLKFPDTWDAMTLIGRETRMLEPFYLEGDAYRFERRVRADGAPDWDLASIAAPDAAVLFAVDTAYTADPQENLFKFGPPRAATFTFVLPPRLRGPKDVFRVDADGVHEAKWRVDGNGVVIDDTRSRDAIYVAASSLEMRKGIEQRRQAALAHEAAYAVDRAAVEALLQ